MSIHTIEKVLWDLMAMPQKKEAFLAAPETVLDGYPLADDERDLLRDLDVRTMADRGCSEMLTMISWMAVNGQETMPEYMRRMNTPSDR